MEQGDKNIGANAAREIESFAGKGRFWLDIDHLSDTPTLPEIIDPQEWSVEKQAAFTTGVWMGQHPDLNSEKKVSEAAGIGRDRKSHPELRRLHQHWRIVGYRRRSAAMHMS